MLELKDAYEILGVREGAGKDEVIKRYDILLKKYKIGKDSGEAPGISIEEINRAYNLLMGYSDGEPLVEETSPRNTLTGRLLRKAGIDEKKAKNFVYYYKFHMLAVLAAILFVGYFVSSMVNRVEPDLNIVIAGDFYTPETESMKEKIKGSLEGLKEVSIDLIYLTDKSQSQQDYAMQMKFVTVMAAGDVDVYILDRPNFMKYAAAGAFMDLDGVTDMLGIDREKNGDYVVKVEDSNEEHLFGIDVSKSKFLKDVKANGELIAVARVKAKHYDNTLKLLKLLAE